MSGSQSRVRGMASQSPGKQQQIQQNEQKGYKSQSTTSIGSASGFNTNYFLAKNKKTSSTPSRVSNAFLEMSPLKGVRPEGMINNQTAAGFNDYLKGELNEEELIYIRNFPSLYAHLPEPKKLYLRMYIRETKGLPELSQKDSLEDRDSVKTNGEVEGNDTEDDYMEDEEFFRKLKSQQGTRHENGHALGSGNRKIQKSVAFRDQQEGRNSIIMDKINSIQNLRMSSLKNYQDSIAERQQRRVRLQNITKSISTLKSIISDNVSLRKHSTGCSNTSMENTKLFSNISGIENSFKQRIENKDLMSSSDGSKPQGAGVLEVRKHLRNLSIITQKVDEQAEKADNGLKDECQTQKLLYKRYFSENADTFMNSLRQPYDPRLRTLLQNSDSQYKKFLHSYLSKAQFQRQKLSQSLHSTALKELTYKDQFVYDKQHPLVFEGKDLLELNQEQTELGRGLLDQIGDLDNFQEKYMVLSLDKLSSGIRVPPPRPFFVPKTRPMQVRQIENQLRKQSTHNTFYQKANRSASTPSTLKGNRSASQTTLSLDNNNNQLKQQSQQQSQQEKSQILLNNQSVKGNSRLHNVSFKQSQRSFHKLSQISSLSHVAMVSPLQTPNSKWLSSFFPRSPQEQLNLQLTQQTAQSTPSNQQPSSQSPQFKMQQEINNEGKQQQQQQQQSQEQQQQSQQKSQSQQQQYQQDNHYLINSYKAKVQRKVALQQLKGYHIIKRNLSEHITTNNNKNNKSNNNDDIQHDESDDSSNASRTEATLDQLYGESIAIQTKILKESPNGLVRKLKQLIKLENLKKEVMDANLYKLEKK